MILKGLAISEGRWTATTARWVVASAAVVEGATACMAAVVDPCATVRSEAADAAVGASAGVARVAADSAAGLTV